MAGEKSGWEDKDGPAGINPGDLFWRAEAYAGATMSASKLDEVIYGE